MAAELTMPKLSDSEADAVILKWLKSPGEEFRRGEALIEVETDKATVVYEAEADGTLEAILVPEGEAAAVGQPIAVLAGAGEVAAPQEPAQHEPTRSNGAPPVEARPNATPVARRTARRARRSRSTASPGTGPGGRITREDVQRAAATGVPAAPAASAADGRGDVRIVELTPTQSTIARRMAQSAATIPVFTVSIDADVSQIVALRRGAVEESRRSLNDFVVKAAALALREFPRFNASYSTAAISATRASTSASPSPPTTRCSSRSSSTPTRRRSSQIAAETRRLAAARPQPVASAGGAARRHVHRLEPRHVRRALVHGDRRPAAGRDPRRRRGAVGRRDGVAMLTLTLSCDHRVVYGADGARFLSRLRELLEQPLVLAV